MFYVVEDYTSATPKMVYGVRKREDGGTEFLFWCGSYKKWQWRNADYYTPVEED